MKRFFKATCAALVAACISVSFFGCASDEAQAEEWNGNPSVVSLNKETAHTHGLISYNSVEEAVAADAENSGNYLSLNGSWSFKLVTSAADVPEDFMSDEFDTSSWDSINVPGNWETQGFSLPTYNLDGYAWNTSLHPAPDIGDDNEIGLYKRTVTVPAEWDGSEVYISLQGVESACYIYVNGQLVGYGEDSYTAKDFRVTPYLEFGRDNTVAVEVYKFSDASWLEAQNNLKLGGIFRDVFLYAAPSTSVKDVRLDTQFSSDMSSVMIYAEVDLAAYDGAPEGCYAQLSLYDAEGGVFMEPANIGRTVSFPDNEENGAYRSTVSGRVSVQDMHLWSAEDPYLYTAVVALYDADGDLIDSVSQKIGFRDVSFAVNDDGEQIFTVNGQETELYGVLYNEFSSVNGKAVTDEELEADIRAMKELNINAVRNPGTAYSSEFLSLCDEYGLYVVEDMDVATYPQSTGDSAIPGDQAIWQTAVIDRLINVVNRDRNHASVIMWSLGTESGYGSVLSTARNLLISSDSRLVVYDGYYVEDDRGNVEFNAIGDVISATDWSMDKVFEVLNDDTVTAPIFLVSTEGGLLSSGGEFDSYVQLMESYSKIQGCFLSYWRDYSLYLPTDSANAVSVCAQTPYSSNPELYTLRYPASWVTVEEGASVTSASKYALVGVISGDGSVQSDAYQLRNVYSPISVSTDDAASGRFTVVNRADFTAVDGNYTFEYEVRSGGQTVSSGTVDLGTIECGQAKEITVDYGAVPASDAYVIIKISHAQTPVWASQDYDNIVYQREFDLTDNSEPVKDGSIASTAGEAFEAVEFIPPQIETTETDLANGVIYITNPSQTAFDTLYTLSYQVIETYGGESVVYASGSVTTGVAAGEEGVSVRLPYSVSALDGAVYSVIVTATTRQAAGSVEAGTPLVYVFDAESLGAEAIPFEIDETRTGISDGAAYTAPEGGYSPIPEGFVTLSNGRVEIGFDVDTGFITTYKVDGVDVFSQADGAASGPLPSIFREPTGGDWTSDICQDGNMEAVSHASSASGQQLADTLVLNRIAADHYRVTLNYSLFDYDSSVVSLSTNNTLYQVVYDIYANGMISVSTAFRVNPKTGIPSQLANVLSLNSDFSEVRWYGKGPGESYSDKPGNAYVGLHSSSVAGLKGAEFLMDSGAGDRSQTSWVSFRNSDGVGVLVTSDDNRFAFNVSGSYSWEDNAYIADTADRGFNVVSIIGYQRGVSAGSLADQQFIGVSDDIPVGAVYSFSYRLVPLTASDDDSALAMASVNTDGTASVQTSAITQGEYALSNMAAADKYLTSSAGGATLMDATGSLNQLFRMVNTGYVASGGFRGVTLTSSLNGLVLSPSSGDSGYDTIEIGLAEYSAANRWQVWYQNNTELTPLDMTQVMTILGDSYGMGYRIALQESLKTAASAWTLESDSADANIVKIRNTSSDLYITVVDNLTYARPTLGVYDRRRVDYPLDVDWSASDIDAAVDASTASWVQLQNRVTLWELLPGESQMWNFVSTGNGAYRIVNSETGFILGIRDVADPVSGQTSAQLVQYDPTDEGEESAALEWRITDLGGYASIINTTYGLALQATGHRGYMSQTDRDYYYITNLEDAAVIDYSMTIGEWRNTANQRWNIFSDSDLSVDIEVNDGWVN